MSSVAQHLLTAEEYWQSPLNTKHSELVRGEVVEKHSELVHGEVVETMPPGMRHGVIAVKIARLLDLWAQRSGSGVIAVEAGYVLSRNPDTVRAPDVSYVSMERLPLDGIPEGFGAFAPDLAVEIISPSETVDEVREKVRDYLTSGTPLVWTIHPRAREVVAHTPDGLARTYGQNDVLQHQEVLPDFSCKVAELFA